MVVFLPKPLGTGLKKRNVCLSTGESEVEEVQSNVRNY